MLDAKDTRAIELTVAELRSAYGVSLDAVVLWGEGMPVDEVAMAAGTVGYELLCAVAPRVPMSEVE